METLRQLSFANYLLRLDKEHLRRCPQYIEWRDLGNYTYAIQAGITGPIKIGKTSDVAGRLRALQTANPGPLRLLMAVHGGEPLEKRLHNALQKDRLTGEWFTPSADLVLYVATLRAQEKEEFGADLTDELQGDDWQSVLDRIPRLKSEES
jgi:hypothetical protein